VHEFFFWVGIESCHFQVSMSDDIKQYSGIQFLLITVCHEGMPEHVWMNFDGHVGNTFTFCNPLLPFI